MRARWPADQQVVGADAQRHLRRGRCADGCRGGPLARRRRRRGTPQHLARQAVAQLETTPATPRPISCGEPLELGPPNCALEGRLVRPCRGATKGSAPSWPAVAPPETSFCNPNCWIRQVRPHHFGRSRWGRYRQDRARQLHAGSALAKVGRCPTEPAPMSDESTPRSAEFTPMFEKHRPKPAMFGPSFV